MMRFIYNRIANNRNKESLSAKLRAKRFEKFVNEMSIKETDRILDVGGNENTWKDSGLTNEITLLNLSFDQEDSRYIYIQGDACHMDMIKDQEYDIVFSNSVIEHVGEYQRQQLFANEILRVGKKIWVQTPYKHFPIEPHFLFPFFQYIPKNISKNIALYWPFSHYSFLHNMPHEILSELEKLNMLSIGDVRKLFGNCHISYEMYFGMIKSLIIFKKT